MSLDGTTAVALAISLVALVVALGQPLAQIVGTVEGHRRCQRSVMGEWPEIVLAAVHTRDRATFPSMVTTLFEAGLLCPGSPRASRTPLVNSCAGSHS